jgi:transposase
LTAAGLCELWYPDESGFAPTLPTGSTWARTGSRALVWDEPPQGRRLNVLGALALGGARPGPVWTGPAGKVDSAVPLEFVWQQVAHLPAPPDPLPVGYRRAPPCIIAWDNASAHPSQVVKAAIPALEAAGVTVYYLPPDSPGLNRIEELRRHVKYEGLPARSYRTVEEVRAAVTTALNDHAAPAPDATTNFREAA